MPVIRYVLRHVVDSVVHAYKVRAVHIADAVEHARIGIDMSQELANELWDDVQYHLEEICGRQDQCCFGMCMLSPSDIDEYGQRLFDITVDKQCADADREYRMAVNAAKIKINN